MQFDKEDIVRLIPQREPMVMIDSVSAEETDRCTTTLTITADNLFVRNGRFMEAGLVENAAQSAAALVGLQGMQQAADATPKIGFIGEVKDFHIFRLPETGVQIQTTVSIVAVVDAVTLVEYQTFVQKEQIATGRLKVFLTNE